MFSFHACFWGNEVIINEKIRYSVCEILTECLNKKYSRKIENGSYITDLEYYERRLMLDPEMDYGFLENYNENVTAVSKVIDEINGIIERTPPYNKLKIIPQNKLKDILNCGYYFFEDGLQSYDEIDENTITAFGYADRGSYGAVIFRLERFEISEDRLCDDDMQSDVREELEQMNERLKEYFAYYKEILRSLQSISRIFKPFIDTYIHHKEAFLTDSELAEVFKKFNAERPYTFDGIKCSMKSFGYKPMKSKQGELVLCEDIHFENLQSFLFYELFYGIRMNYIPNKCKNCGRHFLIRSGKYFNYCDRRLPDEPDKTCRDVGSKKRYDEKCKTDPVWQAYNRAYKAHYARYMKKKMTVAEFEQWSRFASELRDKALADEVIFEEYLKEIRR